MGAKNYLSHFKSDLEDRVNIYEKQLDRSIVPKNLNYGAQKTYIVDLLKEYASLTSTNEKNKRECLRQLESKVAEGSMVQLEGVELEEEAVKQVYQKLARTRETKFLERQKLVNEPAFTEPWTDIETLNLLKGVAKCGEHAWSDICDKYNFQSFRTPNSLGHKWSQLKLEMVEDIQKIYSNKGMTITKWDWIQCYTHKLEMKCGQFVTRQQSLNKLGTHSLWQQRENGRQMNVSQTRVIGSPIAEQSNMISRPELLETRNKNFQENVNPNKKTNVIQQLCNNYEDCIKKFKETIEEGKFSVEDVKKYIATKEPPPTYPKYFELHYVGQKAEENKRPVFRLEPKEGVRKMSEVKEIKEVEKVAEKKEQPISLKKLFLQKKKALLNSAVPKESSSPQEPLNN